MALINRRRKLEIVNTGVVDHDYEVSGDYTMLLSEENDGVNEQDRSRHHGVRSRYDLSIPQNQHRGSPYPTSDDKHIKRSSQNTPHPGSICRGTRPRLMDADQSTKSGSNASDLGLNGMP